jgi:hypothetical protein
MSMARPTRTLNPLHFEDLEPHRFEDLVRQLVYDFKQWRSLEATGRMGSDEGMDIRAIERVQSADVAYEEEIADEEPGTVRDSGSIDRLWVIQCKREANIGPKKVRNIVYDNLSNLKEPLHGYILVAACDFSKSARDAFKDECIKHGLGEYYIWGKGEVEDQLFLPKNDNLLFAYFGISLQVRRRSIRTDLRMKLSLKRKLTKELGEITSPRQFERVLIRDPRDEHYPYIQSVDKFIASPRWRYWEFYAHEPPDHLAFVYKKHFAYVNWETKEYDVLDDYDAGVPSYPEISGLDRDWNDPNKVSHRYHTYWYDKIPDVNRAWAIEARIISYDRILTYDEIGDSYNEGPHLLVEYGPDGGPFEPSRGLCLLVSTGSYMGNAILQKEGNRISFFPSEIAEPTTQLPGDLGISSDSQ